MITKNEYWAVHQWMSYNYKKSGVCESCNKSGLSGKQIHWTNISGKYMRDRKDFLELCASCHQKFDQRYKPSFYFAVCMNCDGIFSISPSRIGVKLFCSSGCYAKARTGKVKNIQFVKEIK